MRIVIEAKYWSLITGIKRQFSHFQCSITRLVSADESSRMAEFDSLNTGHLLEFFVADAEPAFVQELAADKRTLFDGNALDSEVGSSTVEQNVLDVDFFVFEFVRHLDFAEVLLPRAETIELDDFAGRVHSETITDCLFHDFACWQPGCAVELDFVEEFPADVLLCFVEGLVNFCRCLVFGPSRVERLDSVRQVCVDTVARFTVELRNSVVYSVYFLDEALIDLQKNGTQLRFCELEVEFFQDLGDHSFAIVDVDESSRAEATIKYKLAAI